MITPRDDGDIEPLDLMGTDDFLKRYWSEEFEDLRPHEELTPRDDTTLAAVCGTGRSSFALDPYGNVFPCVQWRRPLGNLRDASSMDEIWRSSSSIFRRPTDENHRSRGRELRPIC